MAQTIEDILGDDGDAPWNRFPQAPEGVLEALADPSAETELLDEPVLELDEVKDPDQAEKPRPRRWRDWRPAGDLPVMLLVLGVDSVGWTPAVETKQSPCPICGDRFLDTRTFCLSCLRSGIDARLPMVKPIRERLAYRPDKQLRGGLGSP